MKKTKKGFTLVELVIVVAVMAVLVAVAIPTVSAITGTAKTNVQKTNAKTIESMIKLEEAELANPENGGAAVALSHSNIADALADAKLGITEGSYVYNSKSGICKVDTATADAADFLITFDADSVTVKDHSNNSTDKPFATS